MASGVYSSHMKAPADFRFYIEREYENRRRRNPSYSLRALSRDLGMSSGRLTDLLSGKKGLSRTSAVRLTPLLHLNEQDQVRFLNLVEAFHSRSSKDRSLALSRLKSEKTSIHRGRALDADLFEAVSDWKHFALLQLLKLPGAQSRTSWLSTKLGVSESDVTDCMTRLERLGLIQRTGDSVKPSDQWVSGPDGTRSEAGRIFHRAILSRAQEALNSQPVERRDFLSVVMPSSGSQIEAAKNRIREFVISFNEEFGEHPTPDRVSALSLQYFEITPNIHAESSQESHS